MDYPSRRHFWLTPLVLALALPGLSSCTAETAGGIDLTDEKRIVSMAGGYFECATICECRRRDFRRTQPIAEYGSCASSLEEALSDDEDACDRQCGFGGYGSAINDETDCEPKPEHNDVCSEEE